MQSQRIKESPTPADETAVVAVTEPRLQCQNKCNGLAWGEHRWNDVSEELLSSCRREASRFATKQLALCSAWGAGCMKEVKAWRDTFRWRDVLPCLGSVTATLITHRSWSDTTLLCRNMPSFLVYRRLEEDGSSTCSTGTFKNVKYNETSKTLWGCSRTVLE